MASKETGPLLQQVFEPAGRGDDEVGALSQRADLAVVRRAAVDRGQLQPQRVGQRLQRAGHLGRELAGGQHDDRARMAGAAHAAGQPGQQGEAEGEGLAGAGLGAAEDVWPASASGSTAAWTGVGTVMPWAARAATSSAGSVSKTEVGRGSDRGAGADMRRVLSVGRMRRARHHVAWSDEPARRGSRDTRSSVSAQKSAHHTGLQEKRRCPVGERHWLSPV